MYPYLELFGLQLPTYGLTAVVAAVAGIILVCHRYKIFGLNVRKDEWASVVTYIIVGVLIGAKILYLITVWEDFIADLGTLPFKTIVSLYVSGGLVFYGGIIGAIIAVFLYCRLHKLPLSRVTMALVPSIPLIHGIARIGCYLSGCCGGDVLGLPVQLVESGLLLIVALPVLLLICKTNARPIGLGSYLILYAVMRFILEFFRTDEARGFVGALSTSQFISCLLLPLGIVLVIFSERIFGAIDAFCVREKAVPSEEPEAAQNEDTGA